MIAALIIITVIIGIVVISNYSKKKTFTKVYDLGEELEIESAQVLDYGTYSGLSEVDMTSLLEGFIAEFSEYGEIEKLYFIFGNSEEITVMGYQQLVEEETIYIESKEVGGEPHPHPLELELSKKRAGSEKFSPRGNIIIITINEIEYEFNLKPGENFYFIIVQTIEGEQYVECPDCA